jgi:hypothetical protein
MQLIPVEYYCTVFTEKAENIDHPLPVFKKDLYKFPRDQDFKEIDDWNRICSKVARKIVNLLHER